VQEPVLAILGGLVNVYLILPLGYGKFVHLMKRALFIISDSGGIQEEATAFGKPVLVMRSTTERPEGIQGDVCRLVGTDATQIMNLCAALRSSNAARFNRTASNFDYGVVERWL
jgi:UDP-N-acetylglucosamine 2-epimerase (non-hydrolysing)